MVGSGGAGELGRTALELARGKEKIENALTGHMCILERLFPPVSLFSSTRSHRKHIHADYGSRIRVEPTNLQ